LLWTSNQQIIDTFKLGKIKAVFPSQFLDKTFEEIEEAAKQGDVAARTARKLLLNQRFDKPS